MKQQFKDRRQAGEFLASRLLKYRDRSDVLILALPRGGVPVALQVARALNVPLDVFIVRKLGAPGCHELAMGAIASGGARVLNEEIVQRLKITEPMLEAITREEEIELARREKIYRGDRPAIETQGKTIILIDDGLATGATMRVAVKALRMRFPARIVVAVPIGAAEVCELLQGDADEVVCGRTPESFQAVGKWYRDFAQVTDEDVRELLDPAARERSVGGGRNNTGHSREETQPRESQAVYYV